MSGVGGVSGGPSPLPGGVGVSQLRVYSWPGPDGLRGGSPHVHLACSEAYSVVDGRGFVQTITADDGFRETPLSPGDLVWFTPGTIHRLINDDGLRIVVVMQNAGLPEAGDAVLTFPPDVLADAGAYRAALSIDTEDDVRRRRDLAVAGWTELRRALDNGDDAPLRRFYGQAGALVHEHAPGWDRPWREGPVAAAEATGSQLDALREGRVDHLGQATVAVAESQPRLGMCGWLTTYPQPAAPQPQR